MAQDQNFNPFFWEKFWRESCENQVLKPYEAIVRTVGSDRCLLDIKVEYPHSSQRIIGPFSAFMTSSRSCERHKKHSGRSLICDMTTPSYCIESAGEAVTSSAFLNFYLRVEGKCAVNNRRRFSAAALHSPRRIRIAAECARLEHA